MIIELLKYVCNELERRNIQYMLSGSLAMTTYAVPRFTRDIDIVINFRKEDIEGFLSIFNDQYYLDKKSILIEIEKKGMFNVLDQKTGYKIDFILKKDTHFRDKEFERKVYKKIFDFEAWIVSKEDLIISKFIWIQDYISDMQMDDIRSLLLLNNVNRPYIDDWCKKLNLKTYNMLK